jgi:hypothetical protein
MGAEEVGVKASTFPLGPAIALTLLVAACAGTGGTVGPTATGATGLASPTSVASAANTSPRPGVDTASPTFQTAASSSSPSATPQYPNNEPSVPSWNSGTGTVEAQLLANLRDDAKVACAATLVIPGGATAGAECRPNTALIAVAVVYGFGSPDDALSAYSAQLAANRVQLRTGDCSSGKPGDTAWTPGDGSWGPGGVEPDREGCFIDASGHANVLALCGNGAYVGIIAKTADLAALSKWVDRFPAKAVKAGRVSTPSPPGICYASFGA